MGEAARRKRDALTPPYCEIPGCTYTRYFQRHRIIPGRDGGRYKLGNVIALCPNHHKEADEGLIPADELLEIVRLRIADGEANESYQSAVGEPEEGGSSPASESAASGAVSPRDAADGIDSG